MQAKPTDIHIRQKNELFAKNVREGKTAVKKSTREKLQKNPLGLWALAAVGFVVFGGGEPSPFYKYIISLTLCLM